MKNIFKFVIPMTLCLMACSKDSDSTPKKSYLVLGETSSKTTTVNQLIQSSTAVFDVNKDGVNDFEFEQYANNNKNVNIQYFTQVKGLYPEAKIITNDTLSPIIFNEDDSLNFSFNTATIPSEMHKYSFLHTVIGGDGLEHVKGHWADTQEKYIGFVIEDGTKPILGWFKVSLGTGNTSSNLTIHSLGYQKSVY